MQEPSQREDFWDPLKYISLGREGWYLTLAGAIRPFYEFYHDHNWGAGRKVQMAITCSESWEARTFILATASVFSWSCKPETYSCGTEARGRPRIKTFWMQPGLYRLDRNRGGDKPKLELKLDRQELNYGESSLLAIRELNVRRTFDNLKAIVRTGDWRIDPLAFRPALIKSGVFDDGIDSSQALWGAWATRPIKKRSFWRQADIYYLESHRKQAQFERGTARELRHTVGVVLHAQYGAFSMFTEGDFQLGTFGADNIRAWKYGQSLSWSFRDRPLHPVVSLLGGISSGDTNPASHVLQTFNPLFPSGLYYGYIDSTGSPNAIVLHPELSLTISPTVSISARHFSFWRTSAADGIYSQPGFFLRGGNENQSRYVGSLQDLAVRWRATVIPPSRRLPPITRRARSCAKALRQARICSTSPSK